jgi:hypothetical protein
MKMKIQKVFRPEFVIEYHGLIGFLYSLFSVLKVGIKMACFNITVNGKAIEKHKIYIIPKYKFVRR